MEKGSIVKGSAARLELLRLDRLAITLTLKRSQNTGYSSAGGTLWRPSGFEDEVVAA